ncbi:sushi, von Willebrand factor type A, EGF and pentraxin domain-containing protein 1 isoform X3 [Calliopsis andreniformis]|uniref:sushi, von Willebrand factor type A, EGF and pentraxin domain-containing protein 1 isoform X3 n=1 Tax=Calliopsis andreniformis TaxID=337506 RepID=UPI003FCE2032
MISPLIRKYILTGLLLRLFLSTVCFNDAVQFDEGLHFGGSEEDKINQLFPNFGEKRSTHHHDLNITSKNSEKVFKNKANTLSRLFKIHIDRLKNQIDQVELVFLVDASGSVGLKNFQSELNFVKNLLSDFVVEPSATRVAIVTFGGRRNIKRNVDQISHSSDNNHKCYLLNKQLNNISYTGGGTYTRGALLEALRILEKGRPNAKKAVFLITDGFSNGGDPRPAANLLKSAGATIFTFGIRTGNVQELYDIASFPGYSHSYFLNSFAEFEALARRALHRDLRTGKYISVTFPDNCNLLCRNISEAGNEQSCCDNFATCACGIATGHYACICPTGYFGSGFKGSCQPCPNGTYASAEISGDSTSTCISCPDVNHVTIKVPATSVEHCVCASGFTTDGKRCEVITCPKLRIPENGYLVKASACSNVVHAACGVRCRIGFYLTGDSIRLCGKDGNWSGNEPKCLLKTCPALVSPTHGRMRCQNEEDQHLITDNSTAYPIDTRCQFRCDTGYQLRGSKIRYCLPLSQWDGLTATCKAIQCEPLKHIAHGKILPESCSGPAKVPFATNCTITCEEGFALEGPRIRSCGGRSGVWTQRRTVNRCIDRTPPSITCPPDIITTSLPGKNYAYVNWTVPEVTDNADKFPSVWSKPYVTFPWKVKIGARSVIYMAQDSTGNKARCKFKVEVFDKEPPMIENCLDPPVYFTDNGIGISNISWDEPGFYDNSKAPVHVESNHVPGNSTFLIGLTKVIYNSVDKYNNKANCVLNITVKDICEEIPKVLNGYSNCSSMPVNGTNQCNITCEEGFGFATEVPNLQVVEDVLSLKCNKSSIDWNENNYIPDCSESSVPKTVSQEGSIVLEGNTSVCDNQTTLRELSEYITADLRSTLLDICGNDIECNLITFDPECEENVPSSESLYSNIIRKRREYNHINVSRLMNDEMALYYINKNTKRSAKMNDSINKDKIGTKWKKKKIEIKFKVLGKIIEENYENPREGVQKLRQKIESMSQSGKLDLLNNKTNQEIGKLALNLHLVFKNFQELCEPGSVLKKHTCVKCPLGTFFNSSTKRCQSCPFGEYEDTNGSLKCKRCPEYAFTKKMHAKSLRDCIRLCKPGYYSGRKRHNKVGLALEPCLTCEIGFYQSEYGQNHCLPCPLNSTTKNRASKNINECVQLHTIEIDICQTNSCFNGGQCIQEGDSFSCECPNYYVGSKCETFLNPCNSLPCLNEGVCKLQISANGTIHYSCSCRSGYSGSNCELHVDECAVNPCQNNGTCVSNENDYACECKDNFEGEFCEITVDHCDPLPCLEGSTCRTVNYTWECLCRPGFLGRHCNLLPCDWLPCHGNSLCVNIEEENATRTSYRCECPDGYTGENCTIKVDYCRSLPCRNNGKCLSSVSNYTCTCPTSFTGRNCETELSSDYIIHFTKSGTTDYISMKGPAINLSKLTVCLWLQSKDTFNYGTVLSYATKYYDNAFTLTDYNGLVIYINGQKGVTDIKVNDGYWHFVCITWENGNGSWNVYIDGLLKDSGTRLAKGTIVQGNGTVVIGQEQDRVGGGFSESESFLGKLTLIDIWDSILTEANIEQLFNSCEKYHGNIITWSQVQEHVHGDVAILNSPFCRGCPLPVVPFKGREYPSLNIRCLKQGQWEGYYTPVCTRRKCGFPGYFPRGHIQGRSYLFGDEIQYSCLSGYELRGNPRRVCNADGKWSGLPPVCIGRTCKNLLAPENGDIEYVVEEYERDDLSILQVGQQLEFKCDFGFRLVGEKFLTCLESGVWDHDRPTCEAYGCPRPKEIEHGYITFSNSNNLHGTPATNATNMAFERSYYFDDVIGYSCHPGYKFQGNHNFLAEFKLRCSENGTWVGFVPDCVPLKCPWPSPVINGKIYLKTQNNVSVELLSNPKVSNVTSTKIKQENKNEEIKELTDQFTLGSQLIIKCDTGHKLIGVSVRTCSDREEWSSTLPSCEPLECSILDQPLFKLINQEAKSNNYTNVWRINENKGISEENSYNSSYRNLIYFLEGYTYMKRIIVTCKNNVEIKFTDGNTNKHVSNLTWFCNENGKWEISHLKLNDTTIIENILIDGMDSICAESVCPLTAIPEHGYINGNANNYSRTINSTIIFKCHHGYILQGSERSVCLPNNTWSPIPFCTRKDIFCHIFHMLLKTDDMLYILAVICGKPPILTNAIFKEDNNGRTNFTFGNTITYQCVPGYLMFGQPNTRCLANGKWSRVYSKCTKLSCNKPKLPPGATVHGRSYLYQDQLTYVCPGGKKQGLITCKVDGHWSDPPVCDDK